MKVADEIAKDVTEISAKLEKFLLSLSPIPDAIPLSILFLRWSAILGFGIGISEQEFIEGAKLSWDAAVEKMKGIHENPLSRH